jgi:hypothetical protein
MPNGGWRWRTKGELVAVTIASCPRQSLSEPAELYLLFLLCLLVSLIGLLFAFPCRPPKLGLRESIIAGEGDPDALDDDFVSSTIDGLTDGEGYSDVPFVCLKVDDSQIVFAMSKAYQHSKNTSSIRASSTS